MGLDDETDEEAHLPRDSIHVSNPPYALPAAEEGLWIVQGVHAESSALARCSRPSQRRESQTRESKVKISLRKAALCQCTRYRYDAQRKKFMQPEEEGAEAEGSEEAGSSGGTVAVDEITR